MFFHWFFCIIHNRKHPLDPKHAFCRLTRLFITYDFMVQRVRGFFLQGVSKRSIYRFAHVFALHGFRALTEHDLLLQDFSLQHLRMFIAEQFQVRNNVSRCLLL